MGVGNLVGGLTNKAQGVAGGISDLVQKNPALMMVVPQQFRLPLMLMSLKNGKSEAGQQVVPESNLAEERENTARQFEAFAAMSPEEQKSYVASVRAGDTDAMQKANEQTLANAGQITVDEVDSPTPPQTPTVKSVAAEQEFNPFKSKSWLAAQEQMRK